MDLSPSCSIRKLALSISLICGSGLVTGCQTTAPVVKEDLVGKGNQYARDGLLREAADVYRNAIKEEPRNVTAHRNLGMVLVKSGNYKAAAQHLEKSMKRYGRDFDANFYLAEAYRAQDQYAEAIFRYKQALTIKPRDVKALKPLAWSYYKTRYYSEAYRTARVLLKITDKDDQSPIIMARTLLKLQRNREALQLIKKNKRRVAKESRPYYDSVEGDVLAALGKTDYAIKAYRSALQHQPLLAGALLGLGRAMLGKGHEKAAVTYMERAVRIRPRLTEAHYLLGQAYEKSDRKKALRYYEHFRRQAAADPEYVGLIGDVKARIAQLQTSKAAR